MSNYDQKFNEAYGPNNSNQANQGYMSQQNTNVQQTHLPPSYNEVSSIAPPLQIPQQNYGIPQQNYGIPQQNYGIPQQNYGIPPQNYGIPPQNYGIPPQNYGIPPQSYGIPPQNYGIPPQNYGVQQPNYMPPPQQPPNNLNINSNIQTSPPVDVGTSYCSQMFNSKPQQNSIAAASMIFTSGGMNFAWGAAYSGIGFMRGKGQTEHLAVSWFVGVIIGALFSVYLANKVGKKVIYFASSILVIIGGILITSCPLNISVILLARYMDGIANGLTIIAVLSSGGELAVKEIRGMVVSIEKMSFSIGFMMESISGFYTADNRQDFHQTHGGLSILYGSLALIFNIFFTIESPVYHLVRNNENEALKAQKRLFARYENKEQLSYSYLNEHKKLIEDDASRSRSENNSASVIPILKLSLIRSIVTLTFSLPLNHLFVNVIDMADSSLFEMFYYGFIRFFGNMMSLFMIDKIGRRKLSIISTIASSCILFACGAIYKVERIFFNDSTIVWCTVLLIALQFFVGIGIEPTSSVYLSEAFSLSVKPFCIFLVIFFENILQIITIIIVYGNYNGTSSTGIFIFTINYSAFCYALASLLLCLFLMFAIALPETKGLALRLCRVQFLKSVHR